MVFMINSTLINVHVLIFYQLKLYGNKVQASFYDDICLVIQLSIKYFISKHLSMIKAIIK